MGRGFLRAAHRRVRAGPFSSKAAAEKAVNDLLALKSMREWERSALAETWRDAAHDDEALKSGALVEDLRARA